ALGVVVGAEVAVTAGPRSAERLRELGVAAVFDYHDGGWPARVRDWAGGGGVAAAINAAPGDEAAALSTVANGGRLATITRAPPPAHARVGSRPMNQTHAHVERVRRMVVPVKLPPPVNPALIQHAEARGASAQNRVADAITGFAGSMVFVYIHILWFACWIG